MLDRRTLLLRAAATGAVAHIPGLAFAQAGVGAADAAAQLTALMDHIYYDVLLDNPEVCTSLGEDKGARIGARARLLDRSLEGLRSSQDKIRKAYQRLLAIEREALSAADAIDYDMLHFYYGNIVDAYGHFGYGTHSWPEPYTVSQLGGSCFTVPDFLDKQHVIESAGDAEAYLARLGDFAIQLDNETERLRAEHAAGVIPPDFIIARTTVLLDNAVRRRPEESVMTRSVERRTRERGIAGDWAARAARIVGTGIYPAMLRQAAIVRSQQGRAPHDGGVWRLPKGDEYYAYALRYATTTTMSADDIHRLGLEQMAELTGKLDTLLKSQGLTKGGVAERIGALSKDPRFIYPDTDEGKAKLIADLNEQVREMERRLPEWFGRLPRAPVEIRRVPAATEAGATRGYYQPPALDGSRPGAYYINLRDTAETPKWMLPTLTYHEASPGHHLQIALAQESTAIHKLRRLPTFSVYSEGWGLYAEQVADEMGIYENDPFGRIGYLNSFMFRAARLVVDTGLHHKRWSREQGIAYMMSALGGHEATNTSEVERYCVWPGQATSYMVGQTRWSQLRDQARKRLGERFDIKSFHDTALGAGAIPLAVLERVIEDWILARLT